MATLPFALTGGAWFLYLLGFNLSVATGVGFIALAGVSAEFGVIMLLYLKNALGPNVKTSATALSAVWLRRFVKAPCSVFDPRP